MNDDFGDPTETEVDYELGEAKAQQKRLAEQIARRIRELDDLWVKAKPADRLLAVQRLVQTGALDPAIASELETKNERVREKLAKARTERKRLEKTPNDHQLKHTVFLLELDCQRSEQERDELIDQNDLRGPLYWCGETFVRTEPFGPSEAALKDLATRAKVMEERVQMLEKQQRKGARFTKVDQDGREMTLIRMLPALTMTGEGDPI
jgi:hypothetical protein